MLRNILAGGALFFFGACSFTKDQNELLRDETNRFSEIKVQENYDSDGDGVNDLDEEQKGRNPFIAEIPNLKIRFLQGYKISFSYKKENEEENHFEMIVNLKDSDADYRFRVGKSFARNYAYKTAASFGKYSSHFSGNIKENDFTWISYPEVDSKDYHQKAMEFRSIIDSGYQVENLTITLTNSARLEESINYKSIKNLNLNFYYFNHESDNYDLVKSTIVDRHFQSGIYESFDVVIENAPLNLIKESFFKRGEFLISEVSDYEISDLNMSYKELLNSVKAKSLPVLYQTPLEDRLFYVATSKSGIGFHNVLRILFDRSYKIENDVLVKIGQFENNLSSFVNLKEVKDKNKLGKWFVMTNELKSTYLDQKYLNSDFIVIAYLTGTELANQLNEKIYSYRKEVHPDKNELVISLGNVSPNSKISFYLKPVAKYGRTVNKIIENWKEAGGSCGTNCIKYPINCTWEINQFNDYNEIFKFRTDLTQEAEQIDLIINGESFVLKELLKVQKVLVSQLEEGMHFTINDINLIKHINDYEENQLSLRVKAIIGNDFFGVKLTEKGGMWTGVGGCPFTTPMVAEKFKTQISKETDEIGEISWLITDLAKRNYPYRFELLDSGPFYQEFSFGVSSTIENLYN